MHEYPLVSAVITTHNRCELVKKAIQSVCNQTYTNIECIVVDDASTDDTQRELLVMEQDERIKYIRIDDSKGGNHARNEGVKASIGKIIAFLDDDDEWLPDKIDKQIKLLNPATRFVYCGMIREINFDAESRVNLPIENEIRFPTGDLSKDIMIHILTNTSTIVVERELLFEVGLFDERIRYWQEYDLCIRLLQKTHAQKVAENLVLYRVLKHDEKRLSNNIKGWENSVKVISQKYKEEIDELSIYDRALRKLYIYMDGIARAKTVRSKFYILKYYTMIVLHPLVLFQAVKKVLLRIGHRGH